MKSILVRTHKVIVWYAVLFTPIIVSFDAYWSWKHGRPVTDVGLPGVLNDLGFFWVLSLFYLFAALLFYRDFRETLVTRLAGFKESDEREQLVTAHAARRTFLLTLAVQVVMLAMSLTSVSLIWDPATEGKHGLLSVAMRWSSEQMDIYSLPAEPAETGRPLGYWEVGGPLLPPNLSVVLLWLILLQVGAFKLLSRRHYDGMEG